MAVCGMCHGSGFFGMDRCPCISANQRKAYFAKQAKPKAREYTLPKAHKCGPEVQEFLYEKGSVQFFLCECGKMIKTDA